MRTNFKRKQKKIEIIRFKVDYFKGQQNKTDKLLSR